MCEEALILPDFPWKRAWKKGLTKKKKMPGPELFRPYMPMAVEDLQFDPFWAVPLTLIIVKPRGKCTGKT